MLFFHFISDQTFIVIVCIVFLGNCVFSGTNWHKEPLVEIEFQYRINILSNMGVMICKGKFKQFQLIDIILGPYHFYVQY